MEEAAFAFHLCFFSILQLADLSPTHRSGFHSLVSHCNLPVGMDLVNYHQLLLMMLLACLHFSVGHHHISIYNMDFTPFTQYPKRELPFMRKTRTKLQVMSSLLNRTGNVVGYHLRIKKLLVCVSIFSDPIMNC